MYSIQSDKLAAVALAASDEKGREYLHGVFVEASPTGITMTATNGKVLLTAHQPTETPDAVSFSIIIPSATIKLALAGKHAELTLAVDGEGYRLGAVAFKPIAAEYPSWRRVVPKAIPEKANVEGVWFQSAFLAVLAKAAKLAGWRRGHRGSQGEGYHVYANGEAAALVQFLGDPNMLGVVMPIRAPREVLEVPAWAVAA